MADGLVALRLLIIDDNAQMRTIIGAVLSGAGVRNLHFAQDGREALQIVAGGGIDACFVDYEMPVLNGLDFVSRIRGMPGNERFMPLIMLTGYSDMPRLSTARDRGVNEFLRKPVSARDILSRLEAVILYPRQFITSPNYFGPDRRRHRAGVYEGPLRRASDAVTSLQV